MGERATSQNADCSSLAMLEATVAANPGYLSVDVTVREFATNRCEDPAFLDVGNALVCKSSDFRDSPIPRRGVESWRGLR